MKKVFPQHICLLLLTWFLVSFSSICHALPFSVAPKAGTSLPVEIDAGATATAYYTVTNNTASVRNNNYVKYLPPNVRQVTAGGTYPDTCGATFNLARKNAPGDSCTLQLTVFGAVNGADPNPRNHLFVCFPGGITCAGTNYPLNVAVITLLSITVSPNPASIFIGDTQQYTAIGNLSNGTSVNLTNSVTWRSSSTAVASISATGLATGLTAGLTNITAAQQGISSAPSPLTVSENILQSIEIAPTTTSVNVGQNVQYSATGTYADGSTVNITNSVTWQSSVSSVATINANGLATANEVGSTTITALLDGVLSNEGALTVVNPLVSIAVAPSSATIDVNETQQFTATGTYADGTTANITNQVTWASSVTSVASISSTGLAAGESAGTTMITASADGITSNSATLTVEDPIVSIAVTPTTATIVARATQQFTATATLASGETLNVTSTATWTSSSEATATINSSGLATGVNAGSTNISATQDGVMSNSVAMAVNSFVYVVNAGGTANISYCGIDSAGDFAGCLISTIVANPVYIGINPARNRAYVITNTGVNVCSLNFTNGNITNCQVTATDYAFANLGPVAVNNTNTFAYIINATGTIRCAVNSSNGTLSSCTETGNITANLTGIALNPAGTIAYLISGSQPYYCSVNQSTGALFDCTTTGVVLGASGGGVIVNNSNTYAYITDTENSQVYSCTINGSTGALGPCTANAGFVNPIEIAINANNTIAYITDGTADQVRYCPILGDGTLNVIACTNEPGFVTPFGIAMN